MKIPFTNFTRTKFTSMIHEEKINQTSNDNTIMGVQRLYYCQTKSITTRAQAYFPHFDVVQW